ncbi:MAG: TetR/AcrR family transcriptional regulator, partial [Burkholderiaceae bacterium]|nr:TetR/AcrR family transcriptional regulator [Burkholderiaceae bacterium]
MRKKTEAKRQAILNVATQVFREMGFQNASMNEIAARLGGSKATLYNYFTSKNEIFLAVALDVASAQENEVISLLEMPFPAITEGSQHQVEELFSELQSPAGNIEADLRRFGEKFINFACSDEMLAIRRLLIAESGRSDIGRFYYESGPQKGMERIAAYLHGAMKAGQLREADPDVAAAHLRGLLESEIHERRLLGVEE